MREVESAYFTELETRLQQAISVAETARKHGADPVPDVEIPVATDMADRVENILGIDGVAARVRELEDDYSRERAALMLVEDFVEGNVGEYETRQGKVEGAVRTAVALLTEGVVAAPIEGIDRVELRQNDDGSEFVAVSYAGPIRSAGGTAQALSVLVADYARALLGIEAYQPREDEVERYAEEVALYDKETGLQYTPSDEETKHIARNVPIMLDGEATGEGEVSGFRDLERIDTNRSRGGMCLVLAEGLALKAPKIQRYTDDLAEVEWPWLQALIDGEVGAEAESVEDEPGTDADEPDETTGPPRVDSNRKYLRDLIAGRPVFSHPSEPGGFRLRYGRARNHGFATAGVHPATMHLVDDFLATGTQIKTERPGKAAGVVPVDSIEGPTVKLANGDVRRIDDPEEALDVRNGVEAVLDLGEYLVNYGEFVENNQPLAPASYTVEWWVQDMAAAGANVQALEDSPYVDLAHPEPEQALNWARDHDAPLHPEYTPLYHDIDVADLDQLAAAIAAGSIEDDSLHIPRSPGVREILEVLILEHHQAEETLVVDDWRPFVRTIGLSTDLDREWTVRELSAAARDWGNAMKAVEEVAPFSVRERAPTRIGNRMGRPEKSESRELSPAVHTLFPIGEAGGNQRDVGKAAAAGDEIDGTQGTVEVDLGKRECPECGTRTYKPRCEECGAQTRPVYECPECSIRVEPDEAGRVECPKCERELSNVERQTVDVRSEFQEALASVSERESTFDIVKGVKGLMSETKIPEPMEKGILRAKHGVTAFKDGTVRYDMTDLPVTAVRPAELDVSVRNFRELGYEEDINGDPLEHADQLVELRVQDIVLSDGAAEHMLKTADFVDELLEDYYDLEPFYKLTDREGLVGELVFGMAPHTSAAVVGRVVGFTSAAVGYAHPYFHASKRRNCFHPETKIWFQDERGVWHYDPIEEFVEERLDPTTAAEDDFGTLVQELDGGVVVPSLSQDGEIVRKPVDAVSKHVSTDHLVTIQTRSGRELTVTPDHDIQVLEDDSIHSKMASEVSSSDSLLTPAHLEVFDSSDSAQTFDLLEEFLQVDEIDRESLMVKGIDKGELYSLFKGVLADEWEGEFYPLKSTAEFLGLPKKRLSNYIYRESIPVAILMDLLGSSEATVERIPNAVTLGMKRDRVEIDRIVTLDKDLATLIGYYAAEGFARKQETSKGTIHQATISGIESVARDFFENTLERTFGVKPYRENHAKVTVSGRLMRVFFDKILEVGITAETKHVPPIIFNQSDELVSSFLSGYFSGDGRVDKSSLLITATTVSRELKEDLLALLTRLGISASVDTTDPIPLKEKFPDFYDEEDNSVSRKGYVIRISSTDAVEFSQSVGLHLPRKNKRLLNHVKETNPAGRRIFDGGDGDYLVDEVADVTYVESGVEYTYSLTVPGTHSVIVNDTSQKQCDGDEDCVMLLMDGLLNFSKKYLPDSRGGRMDAPLVMSSRIDPEEIDDEAHNMDTVTQYSREFYEATREMVDPDAVDVELAEDHLDTDRAYSDFGFTHDTSDIALGPDLSAYKTLGSMTEKMDAQLELARKLRAVDETDVAERVIEYHFLPDLIGNLRAFTRQEVRCLSCGTKYRRVPLSGTCRNCGGDVNLT
ncbi:MAG: DNA polymerase II large subunit, partial [Halodesulfurarchaeum sp.]|nr:DNA polymerase II large subunit [Halodesulfurarchaeum sp.]